MALRACAALLALGLQGCSDGTGSSSAPGGIRGASGTGPTLTITGAPTDGVPAGTTVQLGAVVRDGSGKPQSRKVGWTSRDPSRASVSDAGLVTALLPGAARIVATSSGSLADSVTLTIVVPVASVTVSPATAYLYAGTDLQLTATLRDAAGNVLTGRKVAWTSLDAAKASVDSVGKVTALAAGTVQVRASAEGKTADASLTIFARPVPDWSQATDWGTAQGNAKHSGYYPATLDPVVFAEAWTHTVASGVVLNPPALGGGRVYVSTNAYFGRQLLSVLDAGTGGEAWSRDFGAIHGVHPPAYADGSVYVTTSGHEDSFLWGLDAADGTLRFRSPYQNQWSRYLAPTVVGQTVYMAGGYYGGMYAFGTDGAQRWFYATNQYDEWTPAVADGLVYAYTGDYSPRLSVADAATGATVYEIPDPDFDWNGWSMGIAPALGEAGDLLATQAGRLVKFDLAGRRIEWQLRGTFTGNVVVAEGTLYVFAQGQVEARRESDGALLWTWVLEDGQQPRTAIATRNLLLVSTTAHTYAIDLAARRAVWSYPAGGHLALGKDGILAIARPDGKVTAIRVK
ncbi:MAG: PQQ-binding-like beta-propeller repeat protein [Longimicrobiaceae bacterium]